jgi:hypothetical protein
MPFNLALAVGDFGKGGGPTFCEIGNPGASLGDGGENNIAVARNHRRASQRRMKNSFGVWHFRPFPPHLQDSRDSTLAGARFFLAKPNFDHLRCDNDPVNQPLNQFSIGDAWALVRTDPNRENAYGRWMHDPAIPGDHINPDIPPHQPPPQDTKAWAYGAFLIDRYTTWDTERRVLNLVYLMSSASPYQVQLMETAVRLPDPIVG